MSSENLIGQTIGQYQIVETIGRGGMSTVYRAFQQSIQRYVVIKILDLMLATDRVFVERFQREARVVAALEHPHIVPIIDYGVDRSHNVTYIVMRLLNGGTLADKIRRGETLTIDQIINLTRQVSNALDYAHRHGVVHRDIKPTNVLLDENNNAFLTDFGIARMVDSPDSITGTGMTVGTPSYMAPEQAMGVPIDGRADQYALAIMMYYVMIGTLPFEADNPMQLIMLHVNEPAPLAHSVNPNIPKSISAVLARGMAKNPDDRYATCTEFAQALEAAAAPLDKNMVFPQNTIHPPKPAVFQVEIFYQNRPTENIALTKDNVSVGRQASNEIVIDSQGISRYQCVFTRTTTGYSITDLDSANGTYVDGVRLKPNTPHTLNGGEEIQIGVVRLVYQHQATSSTPITPLGQPASPPIVPQQISTPILIIRRGPNTNQRFELDKDVLTLGRDITNDLVINDAEVSRHHCRFTRLNGDYAIEDLGSTNGSFLNGKRISGNSPLKNGDLIGLGETVTLAYEVATAQQANIASDPLMRTSIPESPSLEDTQLPIEVTGDTIEAAIRKGLEQLNLTIDKVQIQLLEEPRRGGLLGRGGRPAKVQMQYSDAGPQGKMSANLAEAIEAIRNDRPPTILYQDEPSNISSTSKRPMAQQQQQKKAPPPNDPLMGTTIAGQYEIQELIGTGPASRVYQGHQTRMNRTVAIKILSFPMSKDSEQRFQRELGAASRLEHPQIVPIYDFGIDRNHSYIVMRLIIGGNLAQTEVSQQRAIPILKQIASALDYTHKLGILHLDIRPANVLLDTNGEAYLVDFGLARVLAGETGLTGSGVMMGTPSYMAPEQWRGDPMSAATDQYAVGIMAYAMLTHHLPFAAETPMALMYKHMNETPPPPHTINPQLPTTLQSVIERVLAKNPDDRYPTVTAFINDLDDALAGKQPMAARPVSSLDHVLALLDQAESAHLSGESWAAVENLLTQATQQVKDLADSHEQQEAQNQILVKASEFRSQRDERVKNVLDKISRSLNEVDFDPTAINAELDNLLTIAIDSDPIQEMRQVVHEFEDALKAKQAREREYIAILNQDGMAGLRARLAQETDPDNRAEIERLTSIADHHETLRTLIQSIGNQEAALVAWNDLQLEEKWGEAENSFDNDIERAAGLAALNEFYENLANVRYARVAGTASSIREALNDPTANIDDSLKALDNLIAAAFDPDQLNELQSLRDQVITSQYAGKTQELLETAVVQEQELVHWSIIEQTLQKAETSAKLLTDEDARTNALFDISDARISLTNTRNRRVQNIADQLRTQIRSGNFDTNTMSQHLEDLQQLCISDDQLASVDALRTMLTERRSQAATSPKDYPYAIIAFDGPDVEPRQIEITDDLTVGRNRDAGLSINSNKISRLHCSFLLDERGLTVRDLGSSNGTFLNDQRIEASLEIILNVGDVVQLSSYRLTVQEIANIPVKTRYAILWLFDTNSEFERIEVTTRGLSVGKAANNDLVLSGEQVADYHASFKLTDNGVTVRSLDDSIPTFIGPQWVQVDTDVPLSSNDPVHIGPYAVFFGEIIEAGAVPIAPRPKGFSEDFAILNVQFPNGDRTEMQITAFGVTVGQLTSNTLVLDHPSIAHSHARFLMNAEGLWVIDLESRTGTFVNGSRLKPNELMRVGLGDKLMVGEYTFYVRQINHEYALAGANLEVGRKFGSYEIVKHLFEFGAYLVQIADRQMTLFAKPAGSADLELINRLRSLTHPNLAPISEVGVTVDDYLYLLTPMLPIKRLAQEIHKHHTLEEARAIIDQIAGTLTYTHSNAIFHNHLTPTNILIDDKNTLQLFDFVHFLVDLTDNGQSSSLRLLYRPPEALESITYFDASMDIYALGILAYQLLSGGVPFEIGSNYAEAQEAILNAVVTPPHTLNPNLPDTLQPVFEKVLAKNPFDRYSSVDEFMDALHEALEHATDVEIPTGPEQPATPVILQAGDQVDHYEIVRTIGGGGVGRVYEAVTENGRHYALKVVPTGAETSDTLFEREVRILWQLKHDSVISIQNSNTIEGHFNYFAMPLLPSNLREWIRTHPQNTPEKFVQMRHFVRKIATALDYIHQQGVLHCDVKPSNILLDENNAVFLTDFGIARFANEPTPAQFAGTWLYMSPEQALNESLDLRTDVFSFGVTVYEMLRGIPVLQDITFVGSPGDIEVFRRFDTLRTTYPLEPNFDSELVSVIAKAIAAKPTDRYQSAGAFAAAFLAATESLIPTETPEAATDLKAIYAGLYTPDTIWTCSERYEIQLGLTTEPMQGVQEILIPAHASNITFSLSGENVNLDGATSFTLPVDTTIRRTIIAYGTWMGDGIITAELFANGEPIDILQLPLQIVPNPNAHKSNLALPPPSEAADLSAHQADLTIRIYALPLDDQGQMIRFFGVAYSPFTYLELDGKRLGYRDVPQRLITHIQEQIRCLVETNPDAGWARTELQRIGRLLWRAILPPELEKIYRDISKQDRKNKRVLGVNSILLLTDAQPWLPFELAVPAERHLCEEFEITRWIEGLGQTRRVAFPLGAVHLTQDADIGATLPAYKPLRIEDIASDITLADGLAVSSRAVGYHLVHAAGALRGQAKAVALVTEQTDWSSYIRRRTEQMQNKAPLITLSTLRDNSLNTPTPQELALQALKSGAVAVVGTWWGVLPAEDHLFWQVLYGTLRDGATLGEAVARARRAIRQLSDNPLDWLAFYAIGDPLAMGYIPIEAEGYLTVRCLDVDDLSDLQVGMKYRFRITLSARPPAQYNAERYVIQPWQNRPNRLQVDAKGCRVEGDFFPISQREDEISWEINVIPETHGKSVLFVDCLTPQEEVFAATQLVLDTPKPEITEPLLSQDNRLLIIDLTDNDFYRLGNKRLPYGDNRPAELVIRRLLEDTIQILDNTMPAALTKQGALAAQIAHTIKLLMGQEWWEGLQPQRHLTLIDSDLRLPWELAAFADRFWGTTFVIGHALHYKVVKKNSLSIRNMVMLTDEHCAFQRKLYADLQKFRLEISDGLEDLPPPDLHDNPVARFCDFHRRTKSKWLHLVATGHSERELMATALTFTLPDNDGLVFPYDFMPGDLDRKLVLKGEPVIFMNATHHGGKPVNVVQYAYKFWQMGASAVIAPIHTIADEFAYHFANTFYHKLIAAEGSKTIGQILVETREHFLVHENSPLGLAYLLFGDPQIRVKMGV